MFILFVLFAVLDFTILHAKVLVITHSYNRPDFIEIQYRTFERFLKDDYEFVVFNDARKDEFCQQITEMCQQLDLRCVRIPQTIHTLPYLPLNPGGDRQNPAARCANVVQYSLDTLGFDYDGIVAIIDSDMFLIKDFSIEEYLKDQELAAVPQQRGHINYIWNGLIFFNMKTLPDKHLINFGIQKIDDIALDVGGQMYYYLRQHPELKFIPIDNDYIDEWTMLSEKQEKDDNVRFFYDLKPFNIEFLLDYHFFHYRSGGNWDNRSNEYHKEKTFFLYKLLCKILQ